MVGSAKYRQTGLSPQAQKWAIWVKISSIVLLILLPLAILYNFIGFIIGLVRVSYSVQHVMLLISAFLSNVWFRGILLVVAVFGFIGGFKNYAHHSRTYFYGLLFLTLLGSGTVITNVFFNYSFASDWTEYVGITLGLLIAILECGLCLSCAFCARQHAHELELMAEQEHLVEDRGSYRGSYRPPIHIDTPSDGIVIQEQNIQPIANESDQNADQNV